MVWPGVVVCPGAVWLAVLAWLGVLVWLGVLAWLGALACGAGALGFGADGAEFVFFCPHAKTGTAINSASRTVFRRIFSLAILNFITASLTNESLLNSALATTTVAGPKKL